MDEQNPTPQFNPQPVQPPQAPVPETPQNIMPPQPPMPPVPEVPQQTYPPVQPMVSDFSQPAQPTAQQPTSPVPETAPIAQPQPMATMQPESPQPFMPMSQSQMVSSNAKKPRSGKLKALLIVLAGVTLLGGGSAAAYFGVVVPNKPENRIAAGVQKMLESDEWTATSTAEVSGTDSIGSVKAESVSQYDRAGKAMATKSTVTVLGIKVPFEVRYVDKSIFMKVDDLTAVKNLLKASAPELGQIVESNEQKVVKQWVEIDSTVYKPLDFDCLMFTKPTGEETASMIDTFSGKGIATIKTSGSETVGGKEMRKYVLDVDEKKLDSVGADLENLTYVKKLAACVKTSGGAADTSQIGDQEKKITDELQGATLDMTLWLDGSNNISQFEMITTDKASKLELKTEMNYNPVNIDKPVGARSIVELIADLGSSLDGVLGQSVERYLPGLENE